jgi:hypothetical protein
MRVPWLLVERRAVQVGRKEVSPSQAHVGTHRLVALEETQVCETPFVGSVKAVIKIPHDKWVLKWPVLCLLEEHRKNIKKLFGVVNHEGSSILDPGDGVLESYFIDACHHSVQFTWEMLFISTMDG